MSIKTISVDQLRVGVYVLLDMNWLDHSFTLNNFKIKNTEQIDAIKALGITSIRIDSTLCDCQPLSLAVSPPEPEPQPEPVELSAEEQAIIAAKRVSIEKLVTEREALARCEKKFQKSADAMKDITRNMFSRPEESYKSAQHLTREMLDSMLVEKDIVIHLMNDKIAGEEAYYHSLNVAILSMMLAKELQFHADDIRALGVGCLFHDIGKIEIPDRIVNARHELSRSELNLLQQHCAYGYKIGEKLGLPKAAQDIIMQHHEYADGSGYPQHLKADKISLLSRVVCVVNAYDNHLNRPNPADSLSPYDALVLMYSHQRKLFDPAVLNIFIRCMGVYPPGTVVRLNDGCYGMVLSVNPGKPLRPAILIYDPNVPKTEAIILDLANEPELEIKSSIKPDQLPREIYAYLSPRKRTTYYFDQQKPGTEKN